MGIVSILARHPCPDRTCNGKRAPLERELVALDKKAVRPLRAILAGRGTEEDTAKLKAIEAEAVEVRARLAEIQG